jgi:tripartite-type tricarboxylate transporter receptor subunit TctC
MLPRPSRRSTLAALCGALLAGVATPSAAQEFPARTVRIVVPFPPGGVSDIIARALAEKLSAAWKQPVVVENRAGAGGAVGTDLVAKSAPDGHTLLIADASAVTTSPALIASLPYGTKDLAPVMSLATFGQILVAPSGSPLQSIGELLSMDKARAARLNVASSGNGTSNHLVLEKFKAATGLPLAHVPYKGASQAVADVAGGQVDLMFTSGPLAQPLLASGKLKAFAVTSARRSKQLPQLPTLAESGLAGFNWISAQGLFAPAGTPAAVVRRINADVAAVIATPEFQARWEKMGLEAVENSPEQFAAWVARETADVAALIRSAGIKVD